MDPESHGDAMASLQRYRNMTLAEVARILAGHALAEREGRPPEQIVADLVCYCGPSWPAVIQAALRLAKEARHGEPPERPAQ